jgi:hypothetical protein
MSSAIKPDSLRPDDRLTEIAQILAAGLMRLRNRQSTPLSGDQGEGSLDCHGTQSGHAESKTSGEQHG